MPSTRWNHVYRITFSVCLALFLCLTLAAKTRSKLSALPQSATSLDAVLKQMDAAAAQFHNAQADFKADNYEKVVNETDTQTGKIYFRRTSKGEMQMASQIQAPDEKEVVYADGKIRVYQPKIAQVNEYDTGKNRSEIESFMVLGFGGGGRELQQQFDVHLAGDEDVDGVKTAKLELSPKDPKVKNMFDRIVMWVDPARAISLKQQFFEPSGNYRLTYYSNIRMNTKISDDVFKLHTTGHTKTVKGS